MAEKRPNLLAAQQLSIMPSCASRQVILRCPRCIVREISFFLSKKEHPGKDIALVPLETYFYILSLTSSINGEIPEQSAMTHPTKPEKFLPPKRRGEPARHRPSRKTNTTTAPRTPFLTRRLLSYPRPLSVPSFPCNITPTSHVPCFVVIYSRL